MHGCRWALSARAGELDLGRGLNARVVNVFLARRDLGALLQGATKLKHRKGYRTRRLGMSGGFGVSDICFALTSRAFVHTQCDQYYPILRRRPK